MYHVDPVSIERTWNLGHIVTAMRVIEIRASANEEHTEAVETALRSHTG